MFVLPPESSTSGSVAGEDGVPVAPQSHVPWDTVTPERTAASLNCLIVSREVSGIVWSPKDSLMMSAWSWVTAQSMPWMITLVYADETAPNTFMPISEAPGATPRTVMLQPGGSGCAGLTKFDTS